MNKAENITQVKNNTVSSSVNASKVMTSDELFAGGRELLIKHEAEVYRLRVTNQGKLILTK